MTDPNHTNSRTTPGVKVVTPDGVRFYRDAGQIRTLDGTLMVTDELGVTIVALYAPGKWLSAEVTGDGQADTQQQVVV